MTSKELVEEYSFIESSILAIKEKVGEATIYLEFSNWMQPDFTGLEPVFISVRLEFTGVTGTENTLPHIPIDKELIMDVNLTNPNNDPEMQVLELVTSSKEGLRIIGIQSESVNFIKQ